MTYTALTVVTSARWLAEDLAAAGTIPVQYTLGLDAPQLDGTTSLWCSGAWATRLRKSGITHPFLSPGPGWLPTVPAKFLRREVWSGRIDYEVMPYKGPDGTFYKLAEHKHSGIPAAIYRGRHSFVSRAIEAFNPDLLSNFEFVDSLHFTASEPVDYRREYRCFIAHGEVTASSFYLAREPGFSDGTWEVTWDACIPPTVYDTTVAATFAQQVVDAMGNEQPPGYVLDVGTDQDGNWSVIEANAAWSSNIYHAAGAGVIESVLASQEPGNDRWLWHPDELFLRRSRPLPTSG